MALFNTIIAWCNSNQGFIMVVLTAIYVVATIFIYRANNKSAKATEETLKQNSKIQKQNVNIQLFNDRLGLYNSIKILLENKHNRISKSFQLSNKILSRINFCEEIESSTILKVKYLFSDECYMQLSKVIEIINQISCICHDINYIYDLIERDANDVEFISEIKSFVQGYEQDAITDLQEEKFKKLCDSNELYAAIIPDDYKHYNFYEMYEEMVNLEMNLENEKCILFKLIESQLNIEAN